jgi:hypothetical protein
MKIVLDGNQLLIQPPHVMVVNQRHRPHHLALRRFPGLLHQLVANQVAKRLRPVGITTLPDQAVELLQQTRVSIATPIRLKPLMRTHGSTGGIRPVRDMLIPDKG